MLWATYYGGPGNDPYTNMAMDSAGNIYIAGRTNSTSGIATPGAHQTVYGGGAWDNYLAKFSHSGILQWATYYGGSNAEYIPNTITDASGNAYICGATSSTSGIATECAYQSSYGGGPYDAFFAKFDSSGKREWATYYGGADDDEAKGMVPGSATNMYVIGASASNSGIATPGAYQETHSALFDAFLAKFHIVTIPAAAAIITGQDSVCLDSVIVLTNPMGGGVWSSADTSIAIVSGGIVTGKTTGIDTIAYLITNGCDSVSATKTIYVTNDCSTGIKQVLPNTPKFTIYPNPAKNELYITSTDKISSVSISDLVGQTLYSHEYNTKKVQVDITGLATGVYLVRINGSQVMKFVKQ